MRANCRNENMCIFCKFWLGPDPKVNYRTGETKFDNCFGLCAKDATNNSHKPDELCYQFKKRLDYL